MRVGRGQFGSLRLLHIAAAPRQLVDVLVSAAPGGCGAVRLPGAPALGQPRIEMAQLVSHAGLSKEWKSIFEQAV